MPAAKKTSRRAAPKAKPRRTSAERSPKRSAQPKSSPEVIVRVNPKEVLGEVPQWVYGHFTEHLVHVIYDGIWGELLYGRKFEEPMVHRARHPIPRPWEPIGQNERTHFLRGPTPTPRHASAHMTAHHCLGVVLQEGHPGGEVGIYQPEVRADKATDYVFRARVRKVGPVDSLRVSIRSSDGKRKLGEATVQMSEIENTLFGPLDQAPILRQHPTLLWMDPMSWSEVTATIRCSATDHDARLAITFDAPKGAQAIVWIDWVSLMAADNIDGLPPRVVEEFRDLPVACLKWPGGCMADNYDWRWGVGPRDHRYPFMDQAWLAWDENDFGTDEFMNLCKLTGAEPYICINIGSGTPELAAAWVEYCNGAPDSRWGSLRAANGHPEPYDVRFWSMGNEQWGFFERGFDGPEGYAARYQEYKEAMLKVDPSITLVAVGQPGEFDQKVLSAAGDEIEVLQIHHYSEEVEVTDDQSGTKKILTGRSYDGIFDQVRKDIEQTNAPAGIKVALDEWGWSRPTHAGALYTAVSLNAIHRAAPLVIIGNRSCVINADGVITREGQVVRREPTYEIFRMYNKHHRANAVECAVEGSEEIDASALGDGRGVSVFIVNASSQQKSVRLDIAGANGRVSAEVVTGDRKGIGAPSTKEAIAAKISGNKLTLPPFSLGVVTTG